MTEQTTTGAQPLAGRRAMSRLSRLSAWLRSALFRQPSDSRLSWQKVSAGVAFIVIGTAVSLARTSGPGALNTTWIEDAGNLLQDGLNHSVLTTLTTQINGYYLTVPRLATAVAVTFPVAWAPAVMSILAAAQYAIFGLIAYIASGPHLGGSYGGSSPREMSASSAPDTMAGSAIGRGRRSSRWLRLLVAAPACLVPLGYTQVNNDLVTVQFIALYGLFWLLLWRPVSRAGQVCAPVIMLGATLTSILPALLAPLVAARLIADRSKTAIAVAVCWAAGLVVQWTDQLQGTSNRSSNLFTNPLWILGNYVTRAIPRTIFGERALGGPGTNYRGSPVPLSIPNMAVHEALIWGACAIVVAVVAIALGKLTAPQWPLAVTALVFSVLLFVGEIVDNYPIVQPRYVIAPALLLYTAIVVMLRPRDVADASTAGLRLVMTRVPVAVFAVLLAVVVGFNYRVVNARSESPPWTAVVAAAKQSCMKPGMADYEYTHLWWNVQIPCSRV